MLANAFDYPTKGETFHLVVYKEMLSSTSFLEHFRHSDVIKILWQTASDLSRKFTMGFPDLLGLTLCRACNITYYYEGKIDD